MSTINESILKQHDYDWLKHLMILVAKLQAVRQQKEDFSQTKTKLSKMKKRDELMKMYQEQEIPAKREVIDYIKGRFPHCDIDIDFKPNTVLRKYLVEEKQLIHALINDEDCCPRRFIGELQYLGRKDTDALIYSICHSHELVDRSDIYESLIRTINRVVDLWGEKVIMKNHHFYKAPYVFFVTIVQLLNLNMIRRAERPQKATKVADEKKRKRDEEDVAGIMESLKKPKA